MNQITESEMVIMKIIWSVGVFVVQSFEYGDIPAALVAFRSIL